MPRTLLALLVFLCSAFAGPTPQAALLVLAKTDKTLAIVDPATLQVIARMPSGPDPHEVVASADGRYAYISNYGGGRYNTITVVDLQQQQTLPGIDLGALRGPHGLMFNGGKVWFTAEAAKAIGSYDPASKTIDWVLGTGQNGTHMLFVFDGLQRIVTANIGSATISLIAKKPGGNWEQDVVPVGRGVEGFDVAPNRKEVWAANAQDGTVSIIDLASRKVVQTLDPKTLGANRLKFTPDGALVLISSLRGPDVTVIDAATRREVKRIPVGHGAAGIQMEPGGRRAYVACTPDSYVVVIDLKTLAVSGRFDAGKQPDGLAWAVQP